MQTIKCLVAALVMAAAGLTVQAQSKDDAKFEKRTLRQAQRMADKLGLDDNTTKKFTETWSEYRKALRADEPAMRDPEKENPDTVFTDEQVEARIKAGFARERKAIDVKEEYYTKFREFLSAKQIEQVYRLGEANGGRNRQGENRDRGPQPGQFPPMPPQGF